MIFQYFDNVIKQLIIAAVCMALFPALGIAQTSTFSLAKESQALAHLQGKKEKAGYPYVTAGTGLYAIGDQAGNFPAIGFHVPGEMGGVWQQPIKLLDGFSVSIKDETSNTAYDLTKSDAFTAYSFTSSFLYDLQKTGLQLTRTQLVPDDRPVLVVEFAIANNSRNDKKIRLKFKANVNLMPVWLGEKSGMIESTNVQDGFKQQTVFLKTGRIRGTQALPPFGVIAETAGGTNPYFATGAGGLLQAMLNGFGRLEITPKGIRQLKTSLPAGWKSLHLKGIGPDKKVYEVHSKTIF